MNIAEFYVEQLKRQAAEYLSLRSGEAIRIKMPQGERESSAIMQASKLTQLVHEITGAQFETLVQKGSITLDYPPGREDARFEIQCLAEDTWQVKISRLASAVAAAPAPVGRYGRAAIAEPAVVNPAMVSSAAVSSANTATSAAVMPETSTAVMEPPSQMRAAEVPAAAVSAPPRAAPAQAISTATRQAPGQEPELNRYLRKMIEVGASDLHMSSGVAPLVRQSGEMQPLLDNTALSHDQLKELLYGIIPEKNLLEFEETNDSDFAHAIPGVARFRANYFMDQNGIGAVFRQIPYEILTAEQLGLPKEVLDLCWLSKGLVLVTGPTGSGKSTTLATLIDYINENRSDHIITIEDPVEFVHKNKKCLVNQREIGTHTRSFKSALRAALREDPDIVLVGEMRDLETISIAIETAETGHLVFGTLHTTTAPSTVDRIIDQFPADQQAQIRTMLAESLKGVVAQVLCKKTGGGRAAAYEILIGNSAIANNIREGKTHQLKSLMQTGKKEGMCTMNDSLLALVKEGLVDPKEAYIKSVDKQGLKMSFAQAGIKLELGTEAE